MTTRDTPEAALAAELHKHWIDSVEKVQGVRGPEVYVVCSCGDWIEAPILPQAGDPVLAFSEHCAASALAALDGWMLVPSGRLDRLIGIEGWESEKIDLLLAQQATIARLRAAGEALYEALWSEGAVEGWAARGRAAMDGWRALAPAPSEP